MPSPDPEAASAAVDLSELRLLFADAPEAFADFCAEIADGIATGIDELTAACSACAWPVARAKAHELRGVAGNAGARDLAARCADFEHLVIADPAAALATLPALTGAAHAASGDLRTAAG